MNEIIYNVYVIEEVEYCQFKIWLFPDLLLEETSDPHGHEYTVIHCRFGSFYAEGHDWSRTLDGALAAVRQRAEKKRDNIREKLSAIEQILEHGPMVEEV